MQTSDPGRALAVAALLACSGLAPMASSADPAAVKAGAEVHTANTPGPSGAANDDPFGVKDTLARLRAAKTPDEINDALRELGPSQDSAAVAPVSKYLANPDLDVADQAAATLEAIGGEKAMAALEQALKTKIPPAIKSRVLEALYFNRTEVNVLPGLLLGVRDADPSVRRNAAYYLGGLGEKKAVPQLQRQLKAETDPETRQMIEWAVAFLKDETNARPPGS